MVGMVKAIKATGCDNCSEPKQITRVTRATIISHCRIRMPVEMVMHNLSPNRWEPKAMREQPAPEEDLFLACLLPFSLPPPFLPFAFFLCRHILPRTCLSHFTSTLSSSVIHPGRTFPGAFLPRPSLQSKPATNPLMVPALITGCSPCTRLFHYWSHRNVGGAWLPGSPGMFSANLGALPSPHTSCPLPFCSRRPLLVFSWRKPKSQRANGSRVPLMLILFLTINQ